jgi:hypothetical protein
MYIIENRPMRDKKTGAEIRNWMRHLEHSLALVSDFKEESRNIIFIFLLNKKG